MFNIKEDFSGFFGRDFGNRRRFLMAAKWLVIVALVVGAAGALVAAI